MELINVFSLLSFCNWILCNWKFLFCSFLETCYLSFTTTYENAHIPLGLLLCPSPANHKRSLFCFALSAFCTHFWLYHTPLPEAGLILSYFCVKYIKFSLSCLCLRDTNILHNSHSTLGQNLELFLAFLWCPYLDLSSSKPLWYFSGWPSSGSSSCRHFCYQHSYKPQTELSDAWCSGYFFCQPEFLSNLSSGYMSVASLCQQLLNSTSTKFGKSTEIAKHLPVSSVKMGVLLKKRVTAFLPSQRGASQAPALPCV